MRRIHHNLTFQVLVAISLGGLPGPLPPSPAKALKPVGPVAYAMPASCLLSPHFPMLLAARERSFPGVEIKVTLCPSSEVVERLLRPEIDFGFVTHHSGETDIHFEPFCEEEYVLVGRETPKGFDLENARWLDHPGADILFQHWFGAKFPKKRQPPWASRSQRRAARESRWKNSQRSRLSRRSKSTSGTPTPRFSACASTPRDGSSIRRPSA